MGGLAPQFDLDLRLHTFRRLPEDRSVRGDGPRDPQVDHRARLSRGDLDPAAGDTNRGPLARAECVRSAFGGFWRSSQQ